MIMLTGWKRIKKQRDLQDTLVEEFPVSLKLNLYEIASAKLLV